MTEISLTSELLTVHVQGVDRWLAFQSQLDNPLKHVTGAEATPLVEQEWTNLSTLRITGTAYLASFAREVSCGSEGGCSGMCAIQRKP